MSDAIVLMSESFHRAVREITIFIESSRLRDQIPLVIIIFANYEALHRGTCIIHIKSP
jgi:hypothetical protein